MKKGQWVHILQMVLTAPGRELYLEAGRLKQKPERVRAILLILLLPVLGVLLFAIRKNFYVLIFGGGAMAVGFFYIYFKLFDERDKILDVMARLFKPFHTVFEKHRQAAGWGKAAKKAEGKQAGQEQSNTEKRGQGNAAAGGEDEYFRRWKEAAGKAKQEKEREKYRREEEWRKRRREYSRRKAAGNGKTEGSGSKKTYEGKGASEKKSIKADSAREEAETIFMVKYPYDEAEIKSKRNMLLKKYHPDNPEGSEEMCKKINECYAVLMKYCGEKP